MRTLHHRALVVPFTILAVSACLAVPARGAEQIDDLLAGAPERIERHRKADAHIIVIDADGKPLPKVALTVEQTAHAFLFGSNIFGLENADSPDKRKTYGERFAGLLNYATLPFYWPAYERQQGHPRHDQIEKLARWCRDHGIATKGHPLAWNYADPSWLPDDLEKIHQLQIQRIDDCVSRFRGLIARWDVVNEATHFDREKLVNRESPKLSAMWKKVGQIEFTRECFLHARKSNPDATLLINDYRHDAAYERVIEQLVDDQGKRLYDVIGLQSHMHGGAWKSAFLWEICQRFARFGVPLHFTETTILSGQRRWSTPPDKPWDSTSEGEAYQAQEVARFYTILFSHPAVEAVTWWDFSDFGAWKDAPGGLLRKDMSPKPAYEVLRKLVKHDWWTRAELHTDEQGRASLRGFLGDYRVTVHTGGKTATQSFQLGKTGPNEWRVAITP